MTHAVAFAPGRVNLIGEHTDYNGGLSLPFAIEQGLQVAVEPDQSDEVHTGSAGAEDFVRGTVAELRALGIEVPPGRVAIGGDLPEGSGLSSSAALGVALALALARFAEAPALECMEVARLCSRVENDWVGAQSGLLDQIASLFGRRDHAMRVDFRSLEVHAVPMQLGEWTLAVADSGERHSNAEGGYNERRRECAEAASRLGLETLRDADRDSAERLPDPLGRRVLHVIDENGRVEAAVAALEADDLDALGRLLDEGHASLRDLYDASTDAVERVVTQLKESGAAGARMMGGGFGGHVLALFPPGTDLPPGAHKVAPSAGAHLVET